MVVGHLARHLHDDAVDLLQHGQGLRDEPGGGHPLEDPALPQGPVRLRQGQALVDDAAHQAVLGGVVAHGGRGGPGGRNGSGGSGGPGGRRGPRRDGPGRAGPLRPLQGPRAVKHLREVINGRLAPVPAARRHVPDGPGSLGAVPGGVHADVQHGDGLARLRQVHRRIQVDDRDGGREPAQVLALEALHVGGRDREALVAPQDPGQDLAGQRVQRHEVEDAVVPGQGIAVGRVAQRAGLGGAALPGGEPLDP